MPLRGVASVALIWAQVVTTLGKMSAAPRDPGVVFALPLSDVRTVSVKTRLSEEQNFVPTREGLTVELDTAILYALRRGWSRRRRGEVASTPRAG